MGEGQSLLLAFPTPLDADWRMTVTRPDAAVSPRELPPDAVWHSAAVPGTALQALRDRTSWVGGAPPPLHDHDVWFRTVFDARAGEKLRLLGLAGLAEVWIGDACVLRTESMFVAYTIALAQAGATELAIRFRSLTAALRAATGRSRWRTKLVTSNGLRAHRQTLLGHMPGWCPSFHAVGPFRPIERIGGPGVLDSCVLQAVLRGTDGVLSVRVGAGGTLGPGARLRVRVGRREVPLERCASGQLAAEMLLPDVALWWPHTHGTPVLHDVFLVDGASELRLGRVGFRTVRVLRGDDGCGFGLAINGVPVFCRGACWTNADLLGLGCERETYATWLRLAVEAGMNMIRVGGTMLYESTSFHDLCDEMGILVWQDLMFANLDYATEQPDFRDNAVLEVEQLVRRLAGSPSLVVVCGGSEMAQQSTLLGLAAERRAMAFFEVFLPALIERLRPDLQYVPHSPWGGALPTSLNEGISHYYGVGAYRRKLEDARRAGVRFATECLALANPPGATSPCMDGAGNVPRDRGASWSFADTRDHYLQELYLVDPAGLRGEDPQRYLDVSRAVTADLMEAVFAEWRRPGSRCAGGLVWQLQDLEACSGWGVIDSHAHPKAAWHGLRRVLAPVQILLSDEGLDGLVVHVLNETAETLSAVIHLACLARGAVPVVAAERAVEVAARGSLSLSSQSLLDGFFDISRAYRFGPPEHSVTIATLRAESGRALSEAFHFPVGRALPRDDLGLSAAIVRQRTDWFLDISAARFAQAVHVEASGYRAVSDWFHLPPSVTRRVALLPDRGITHPPDGVVAALNGMQAAPFRGCS